MDEGECTPEIEASYRKLMAAAPQGPAEVRKIVEEIQPGTRDWIRKAWDVLEAQQQGRPRFLWADRETAGLVHWSPERAYCARY